MCRQRDKQELNKQINKQHVDEDTTELFLFVYFYLFLFIFVYFIIILYQSFLFFSPLMLGFAYVASIIYIKPAI